jgi:5-methylcytosine-specific restriction endonuclease McrA
MCPYCGVTMNRDRGWNSPQAPSRDHRVPRSRGGTDRPENILVCCRMCNEDKASLTTEEYMAVRAGNASRLDHIWNAQRSVAMNMRIQRPSRKAEA